MIEWVASILVGLSVWFYPAVSGWKRLAAPSLGLVGNLVFVVLFIPIEQLAGGVIILNVGLASVNGWNLYKAVQENKLT